MSQYHHLEQLVDFDWDAVQRWWKEYLEGLLNAVLSSAEEAEVEDLEGRRAEVLEVVRKLLGGKAMGVNQIRPEYLGAVDL